MVAKERTTISIDNDLLRLARGKGLNVSGIVEDSLRQILLTFDQDILPENCKHNWTSPFCTPYGLAKECLKCRTIKKVKIENFEKTQKRYKS